MTAKIRDEEGRGGDRETREMGDRALESRALADERIFDEDPFLDDERTSLLRNVDLGPDWTPSWRRWSIQGQTDGRNISMTDASKHQYVPVHPDEVPQLAWLVAKSTENVGSLAGVSVRVGDLMLFKKPSKVQEAYLLKLQRDADQSVMAIKKRNQVADGGGSNLQLSADLSFTLGR